MTIRDRIQKVLKDHNDASIYSLAKTSNERTNMQRQINGDVTVSVSTIQRVLEAFPETSALWLLTGEGLQERTRIVTPPQQRQDIHLATGARAAISQSGSARIEPDEPIGQESLTELLNEKDARITELERDIATLKDTIRILSAK